MMRHLRLVIAVAAIWIGAAHRANSFSLLGPYDTWMTAELYYTQGVTVGGPMNLGEEYRWNVPTLTFAFDESFFNYFGESGVKAIEAAMKILNDIPEVSDMSADLSEFPLTTKRMNYRAQTLGLADIKSFVLGMLLEQIGVTSSDRFAFCVRNCYHPGTTPPTAYPTVIMRNFDPVTLRPSPYVNGTLYTYHIFHTFTPAHLSDAVEDLVNPIEDSYTAVSSIFAIYTGQYYVGLTRDDIAALRYIYRQSNINAEQVNSSVQGSYGASSPWTPVGTVGLTNFINVALRPGIERLKYTRVDYDSLVGGVIVTKTNDIFKDQYILGGKRQTQTLVRSTTLPDILFDAADLGVSEPVGFPVIMTRSGPADSGGAGGGTNATGTAWVNNADLTINGIQGSGQLGPGVINGPAVITLSKLGPAIVNFYPSFITEANNVGRSPIWGSFDGTTNEPVVYPNADDIYAMEKQVFEIRGVYNPPWYPALATSTNTTQNTNTVVVGGGGGGGGG
jgi:hypothetical protein